MSCGLMVGLNGSMVGCGFTMPTEIYTNVDFYFMTLDFRHSNFTVESRAALEVHDDNRHGSPTLRFQHCIFRSGQSVGRAAAIRITGHVPTVRCELCVPVSTFLEDSLVLNFVSVASNQFGDRRNCDTPYSSAAAVSTAYSGQPLIVSRTSFRNNLYVWRYNRGNVADAECPVAAAICCGSDDCYGNGDDQSFDCNQNGGR